MSKRAICLITVVLLLITSSFVYAEPFSTGAVADIELGNDGSLSPDGRSEGSGVGARNVGGRRRVMFFQYDISALKVEGGGFPECQPQHLWSRSG